MSQDYLINLKKSFFLSSLLSFLGIFLFFLFYSHKYENWAGLSFAPWVEFKRPDQMNRMREKTPNSLMSSLCAAVAPWLGDGMRQSISPVSMTVATHVWAGLANGSWRDDSNLRWVAWWISERRGKKAYWDRPSSKQHVRSNERGWHLYLGLPFVTQVNLASREKPMWRFPEASALKSEVDRTAELAFVPGNGP